MSSPVGEMFGRIAGAYDLLNHVLSFGIDRAWRAQLADLVSPGGRLLLDLAAGTLDVALAINARQPQAKILAMDFCPPMLARGRRKLATPGAKTQILPCAADALNLPLPDASVDAVTIAFGIRNIQPRIDAFAEMKRVLKPGGRVCVLEFGSAGERILGGLYNVYLERVLPAIGRIISRDKAAYEYLARTIREFPPAPELAAEMETAGFAAARYRKLTGGIVCLHWAEKPLAPQAQQEKQKDSQG